MAHDHVRVLNAADSKDDQFYVSWAGDDKQPRPASETAVYVPPGQSRVVKLPRSAGENIDILVGGALLGSGEIVIIEENIGVRLTSGFLLDPEQSTSAIVVHHPGAKYFVV